MTDNRLVGSTSFPIIGMGASPVGLEAFDAFFRACPAETGMGFVLVPHLDPDHVSLLTGIPFAQCSTFVATSNASKV